MTGAAARKAWMTCAAAATSKTVDYLELKYDMY